MIARLTLILCDIKVSLHVMALKLKLDILVILFQFINRFFCHVSHKKFRTFISNDLVNICSDKVKHGGQWSSSNAAFTCVVFLQPREVVFASLCKTSAGTKLNTTAEGTLISFSSSV